MAISQNFSTIRPSLSLDFTKSKRLDSRLTFTRTSSATFTDEDGYIKLVSSGRPRFDHNPLTGECNGILVEESRTNLCRRSEEFNDTTFWGRPDFNLVTVTPNVIISPDGTVDADLAVNVGGAISLLEQIISVPASSTTDYYVTIYAKKGTASYFTFNCYYIGNTEHNVDFFFDTQTVSGAPNSDFFMQHVGNGWYRCGFRMNRDATGTRTAIAFRMWHSGRTVTSGNTYFWGAQMEAGRFATSYIPTTTASVTRNLDNLTITGSNFINWYNPLEGTFVIDAAKNGINNNNFPGLAYVDDGAIVGGTSNNIGFYFNQANALTFESYVSDVVQISFLAPGSAKTSNQKFSISGAYRLNDSATSDTGSAVLSDTTCSVPTVNRLVIGNLRGGGPTNNWVGTISKLNYYPNRLSNTQLQTLTR